MDGTRYGLDELDRVELLLEVPHKVYFVVVAVLSFFGMGSSC